MRMPDFSESSAVPTATKARDTGGNLPSEIDYILPYCKEKKVLDIGFAGNARRYGTEGWRHKEISEVADYCFGIDIQRKVVEKAREDGWNVNYGNAERFELEEKFDVVIASQVFEHIENLGSALESIKKHLRKNGLLVVTTPNPRYIRRFMGAGWDTEGHIVFHHPTSFRKLAEKHGFERIKFEYIDEEKISETLKGRLFFKLFVLLPQSVRVNSWLGVFVFERKLRNVITEMKAKKRLEAMKERADRQLKEITGDESAKYEMEVEL